MPRRNRVAPDGVILAAPDRGTFMGNRGKLHDAEGRICRDWRVQRWLICDLDFNERRRTVMAPDRYTELFFLDEATALAAGHRPCFECRRPRFLAFQSAMEAGLGAPSLAASDIDDRLHRERLTPEGAKRTFVADLERLPDGVFVALRGRPHLVSGESIFAWSFGGYSEPRPRPAGQVVVLTPPSTVAALAAGYRPVLHALIKGMDEE
ncbi:hypothetical protein [Paludisphaera rhizosphaerae]|uniref:hypothetical protein n=1 Tax=Paludisphaera rhizosphaerae TaxID=2711216 RepID=UPI0013E9CED6|nr:hypothetical protein [Paludisphaera rhizosphaerae]